MLFPDKPHSDWFEADGHAATRPDAYLQGVDLSVVYDAAIFPTNLVADLRGGLVCDERGRVLVAPSYASPILPPIFSQVVTISHDISGLAEYGKDIQYYNNGWLTVPAHTNQQVELNLPPITISGRGDYVVSFGTPDKNNNTVRITNASAGVMREHSSGSRATSNDQNFTFPTNVVTYTPQAAFIEKAKAVLSTFGNLSTWQYYPREDFFNYFSPAMADYPLSAKGTGGVFPFVNVGYATSAFMRIASAQYLTRTLLTHEIDQTATFSGTKLVSGRETRNCDLSYRRTQTRSISFFGFCCNPSKPILATPSGTIGLTRALTALRAKGVEVTLRVFLVQDQPATDAPENTAKAAQAPFFGPSPAPVAERTLAKTAAEINGVSAASLPVLPVEPILLRPNRLYAFEVSITAGTIDTHEESVTDKGITANGYKLYSATVQSHRGADVAISSSTTAIDWSFVFVNE
jgi:hypothetical protein